MLKVRLRRNSRRALVSPQSNSDEQEFQRGPQLVQELFTPRTRDPTVLTTYQECLPPPRLASLDKYAAESLGKSQIWSCRGRGFGMVLSQCQRLIVIDLSLYFSRSGKPGGPASCLEKYTNPKFFLNQWLAAERSRLVLEKRRRENRKESRRQRRDDRKRVRGAAARGGVAAAAAGVRQVHIKHKAAGVGASGRASVSGASYERRVTASNVQSDMVKTSSSSSASAVVPASSGRTASTTPSALAGIPSRQQQQHQQQQEAEQRRQVQLDQATMHKEALQQQRREDEERRRREEQVRVRQQQEQQQQQQEQTQPHLQQGAQEQQTQEPIRSTPPTPPPLPAMGVSSGPPVPPALPTAGLPGLPPPPTATGMRPVSMGKAATGARKNLLGSIQNFSKNKLKHTEAPTGGGGARAGGDARSNLMAAIRSGGKGLRHTEAPSTRNKPLDARSSLMSMIRSGGAKLKKTGGVNSAKAKRAAEMKKKRVSGGVAAILARRMAIVGSDSDDSDDDSDDDDDWD